MTNKKSCLALKILYGNLLQGTIGVIPSDPSSIYVVENLIHNGSLKTFI